MNNEIMETRPKKRTKIVATIGPSSANETMLRKMILAGMDVVRINFSHGEEGDVVAIVDMVRKLSQELKTPIAILGDLRGPRIRVGDIEGGSVELKPGQRLTLTPQPIMGSAQRVSVSFTKLAQDVILGSLILLDDGNIELKVEQIEGNGDVVCRVVQAGVLSSRRGLNLPGRRVTLPSLTHKDFEDIAFAIKHNFDFLALSFVQSVDDIRLLKAYLASQEAEIPVVAKIERRSALNDIEKIVQEVSCIMVARGDLALEMSLQDVPFAQKHIIDICRRHAIPVITATQMLESMVNSHKPTRAEVTDVANAILDGTDAIMLSAETAIGKYPAETVAMMSSIAIRTESAWLTGELPGPPLLPLPDGIDATIAYASQVAAKSIQAKVIVIHTTSGATGRRVTCHRPTVPVLALSSSPAARRRLALIWGVESELVDPVQSTKHMVFLACHHAIQRGHAQPGDIIVVTAGTPYGTGGRTNTLKIEEVPFEVSLEEFEGLDDD